MTVVTITLYDFILNSLIFFFFFAFSREFRVAPKCDPKCHNPE